MSPVFAFSISALIIRLEISSDICSAMVVDKSFLVSRVFDGVFDLVLDLDLDLRRLRESRSRDLDLDRRRLRESRSRDLDLDLDLDLVRRYRSRYLEDIDRLGGL